MENILIVEDDKILNKGLSFTLKGSNYNIISAFSKDEGKKLYLERDVNLIILDINLTDGSGIDLCKEIREKSQVPIIILTANDTEDDMIEGFKKGCDDYIIKPFSIELLKHRIAAILRRSIEDKNEFNYKDLNIDFDKMLVKVKDKEVKLTSTEYKLLELLVKNKKQVLTRNIILEKLWDAEGNFVDENALNVYIRRLRKKIEPDLKALKYIITVFGVGYTFGE